MYYMYLIYYSFFEYVHVCLIGGQDMFADFSNLSELSFKVTK